MLTLVRVVTGPTVVVGATTGGGVLGVLGVDTGMPPGKVTELRPDPLHIL